MAKTIDIKRTLGKPAAPLSIEDVEAMTRLIHDKTVAATQPIVEESPKMNVVAMPVSSPFSPIELVNYEETTEEKNDKKAAKTLVKTAEKAVETTAEKAKRGRKPKMLMESERLLRVSVDLPESVFIQLKIAVIQQQTDMKTYIRQLIERDRGF